MVKIFSYWTQFKGKDKYYISKWQCKFWNQEEMQIIKGSLSNSTEQEMWNGNTACGIMQNKYSNATQHSAYSRQDLRWCYKNQTIVFYLKTTHYFIVFFTVYDVLLWFLTCQVTFRSAHIGSRGALVCCATEIKSQSWMSYKASFPNLVTADIVVTLVHTAAIRSSPQRLGYWLDVWQRARTYDWYRPASVALAQYI